MSSNAERFGLIVKEWRERRDLNQLEVSQAGGPSNTKMTEIENGRLVDLTPLMAKKLDKGLRWVEGSARRTWLGGEPTPIELAGADVAARIAEIEAAAISESTKRWIIEDLMAQRRPEPKAGESA